MIQSDKHCFFDYCYLGCPQLWGHWMVRSIEIKDAITEDFSWKSFPCRIPRPPPQLTAPWRARAKLQKFPSVEMKDAMEVEDTARKDMRRQRVSNSPSIVISTSSFHLLLSSTNCPSSLADSEQIDWIISQTGHQDSFEEQPDSSLATGSRKSNHLKQKFWEIRIGGNIGGCFLDFSEWCEFLQERMQSSSWAQ